MLQRKNTFQLTEHQGCNESESIKQRARDKIRGQNTGQGQK